MRFGAPGDRRTYGWRTALLTALLASAPAQAADAATFTVTTSADTGAGSLRAAITSANAGGGPDTIAFAIGMGNATIAPASGLPVIADPVTIDGTTQPGFVGTPLIELDGVSAGADANGLTVAAGGAGSVVRALSIGNFATGAGVAVGASGTTVTGSWLGVDTASLPQPNGSGVTVLTSATATVGGATASDRNVIAGNLAEGVSLNADSASATIRGNFIGITPTVSVPNGVGVLVNGVAASALVGAPGARNVISANTTGILVASTSTATIDNNIVGLRADGSTPAPNGTGISIGGGAIVAIGGTEGNVVSANGIGAALDGKITLFANNRIGTDAAGAAARANGTGVQLLSTGTTIGGSSPAARNVISGNGIGVQVTASADDTTIAGNYIGVGASGATAIGNTSRGITVEAGATGVTIGGALSGDELATAACDGPCNVVSATNTSGDIGIAVAATATGAKLQGNAIGTRADGGVGAAPNPFANQIGMQVLAADATIGGVGGDGVTPTGRNIVAGKGSLVMNTTVGIDASGANLAILANHVGVLGDGMTPASLQTGVKVAGSGSRRLGDTLTAAALATATCDGACNLVAASLADDVSLTGTGGVVRGNRIGTNATATASLGAPVAADGIQVGAGQATIGGPAPGDRNLVSGHAGGAGIRVSGSDVAIHGNDIGTAAGGTTGTPALRNDVGVSLDGGSNATVGGDVAAGSVGGACDDVCNVLSNNFTAGVVAGGAVTATIAGNHIGVTRAGTAALGNTVAGVSHRSTAAATVGGTGAARRNVVSGNDGSGIETTSAGTGQLTVQGNYLGVAADGTTPAANGGAGIHVATKASIGGTGAAGNRIAHNTGDGVFVAPEATGATTVLENEIFANGQLGIDLGVPGEPPPGVTANDAGDTDIGGNGLQNFPVLTGATTTAGGVVQVRGALDSAAGSYTLRVYANDACAASGNGEAGRFVGSGSVTAGASFSTSVPASGAAPALSQVLTATVTDAAGHTSELSPCVAAGNGVTLSAPTYSVAEAAGSATISVQRAFAAGGDSVRVDTVAGGSATGGADYSPIQQVVQFDPGQTTATAAIPILDDSLVEGAETINVKLTNPSAGLALGTPPLRDSAVVTITSDDVAPPPPPPPPPLPPPPPPITPPPPAPGTAPPPPASTPRGPDSNLDRLARSIRSSRLKRLTGTATDPDGDLARVEVALVSTRGRACLHLGRTGRVIRRTGRCAPRTWLRARGTDRWALRLPRRLPTGTWKIYVRATDAGGRRETSFSAADRNLAVVRIRRG